MWRQKERDRDFDRLRSREKYRDDKSYERRKYHY